MEASCFTGSTNQIELSRTAFADLQILLPPLPEQRKIAAILSSVDEAIEGTQAVIDQLQVVKKAMMADLLTRGIPGRHKKFKQTEIGEVPEEWEATTVGELGEFSGGNGFRPPDWSSAGLPIIRIQNLNGSQDFHYFAGKPDLDWLVEPGELLFAWAGSRGASFGPCIWPGPQGVLNQHIHRIKPFPSIRKRFFFYLLQIITQEVEKKAHGFKDTLVHLRKAELTNWPVALPWITEQDMIVASLDSAGDRLLSEAAFLDGLKATKSALMSVLLTGEVRVRADEESAA
jgi:type I restriction enzyme S subunit